MAAAAAAAVKGKGRGTTIAGLVARVSVHERATAVNDVDAGSEVGEVDVVVDDEENDNDDDDEEGDDKEVGKTGRLADGINGRRSFDCWCCCSGGGGGRLM